MTDTTWRRGCQPEKSLPAFLTKGAGMFCGMVLSRYTADALIVEQRILRHVARLDEDRPLYTDHTSMQALIRSGEILDAVEAEVGSLE